MSPSICSMRLIYFIATVVLTAIPLLQAIGSYNNVAAQSYFPQEVRITIDKGQNVLGNYGVIITNSATSAKVTNFYTDTPTSPQTIYIPGRILAVDGDTLVACAMIMVNQKIACDTHFANSFSVTPLQFYIDMNNAHQVTSGGLDQFQPQEFNGYASLGNSKLLVEG